MAAQDNLARKPIYIPATQPVEELSLRVAAYCRVSSDSDDQLNSFAAQQSHYYDFIHSHDHWELADIYADEGITGTAAVKRDDFQRMLSDCRKGRIDKDATDLVMQPYQDTVGTLVRSDHKGIRNQYVSDDKCIVNEVNLIRRLTPLECERLQGFPDGWTNIPSASDSARYKALGNSVAIPCVEFVMKGVATFLKYENAKHRRRRGWLARPSLLMAA